jgi:hypothetical protein
MLSFVMLSVVYCGVPIKPHLLSVIVLRAVMLSVIMLRAVFLSAVVVLSIVMLSVVSRFVQTNPTRSVLLCSELFF